METLERLRALLPADAARTIDDMSEGLTEVRLRANRPVQLRGIGGDWLSKDAVSADGVVAAAASLMDHSLYARERELSQGFFTMADGCRVGVCGRMIHREGGVDGIARVGSISVRICRAMPGCADALYDRIAGGAGGVRSTLLLSAPGMGKTTCLRELARRVSLSGRCVAIADERRELAACRDGAPTLDVGPRTDVMDALPKRVAIMHLLRAMSPEVIVADEIGAPGDAEALTEAARCGVTVLTSAHSDSLESALGRPMLSRMIQDGIFSRIAVLGDSPGGLKSVIEWPEVGASCG